MEIQKADLKIIILFFIYDTNNRNIFTYVVLNNIYMEKGICPECNNEYKSLGGHWRGSCSPPKLTKQQKEIATGLMMGDGFLAFGGGKNPSLRTEMISPNYLEYLDDIFGCLSTGVKLEDTAEESALDARKRGFSQKANKENYSDLYRWSTRSLEELNNFNWYKNGSKIWPDDINLTPTTLKHWYVGDGCFINECSSKRIKITMSNEVENTNKVDNYFKKVGLPSPSNYSINKRDDGNKKCDAQFTQSQSEKLLEYMGEPLPDFEYKF
jgi:hypothetical protein